MLFPQTKIPNTNIIRFISFWIFDINRQLRCELWRIYKYTYSENYKPNFTDS
jgi:hypothetical protein